MADLEAELKKAAEETEKKLTDALAENETLKAAAADAEKLLAEKEAALTAAAEDAAKQVADKEAELKAAAETELKAATEAVQTELDAAKKQLEEALAENETLKAATNYSEMGEDQLAELAESLKEPLAKIGITLTKNEE